MNLLSDRRRFNVQIRGEVCDNLQGSSIEPMDTLKLPELLIQCLQDLIADRLPVNGLTIETEARDQSLDQLDGMETLLCGVKQSGIHDLGTVEVGCESAELIVIRGMSCEKKSATPLAVEVDPDVAACDDDLGNSKAVFFAHGEVLYHERSTSATPPIPLLPHEHTPGYVDLGTASLRSTHLYPVGQSGPPGTSSTGPLQPVPRPLGSDKVPALDSAGDIDRGASTLRASAAIQHRDVSSMEVSESFQWPCRVVYSVCGALSTFSPLECFA